MRLSGYPRDRFQGDAVTYASLTYMRELARLPSALGRGVYAGAALEAGNVWEDLGDFRWEELRPGVLFFTGTETTLGALYFGYGLSEGGDSAVHLFMGWPF
jgi:NTE family protein